MGQRLIHFPTRTSEVRKGEESNQNPILTTTPYGVWGVVRNADTEKSEVRKNLPSAGTFFPDFPMNLLTGRPSL